MPELIIDGRRLAVLPGTNLLQASRGLGIDIPTLCFLDGYPHHTSCMVCLVEDLDSGTLLPACATPAGDGQRIRTDGERLHAARRRSLELLLSEHAGDCEAPCTRACPAHPDLPGMIRKIAREDTPAALAVLLERLPLAGTLATICPAPCERACRRGRVDTPVAIRALKREAVRSGAKTAGERRATEPPVPAGPTGREGPAAEAALSRTAGRGRPQSVAVVGAGPAGLAAAYFLARWGHRCTVFDDHDRPGGELLRLATEGRLPTEVIAADLAVLDRLGVLWRTGVEITREDLPALRKTHAALVLAPGSPQRLARLAPGERFDRLTAAGATAGVFACGNATRTQPSFLAVQAVADGRRAALTASAFLAGLPVIPERRRFDSHLAARSADALALLAQQTAPSGQAGAAEPTSSAEAQRCLRCDCAAKSSCRLRDLSGRYGAEARHFAGEEETPPRRTTAVAADLTGRVSFEPGKCIKCGICVRIAEQAGERPGLAFSGRGYEAGVRVPFGEDLGRALGASAREAARRCPTGALIWEGGIPDAQRPRAQTQAHTRAQKGWQS